ncbi:UDP-N-acetylmuramate--alanine ligase, partial [Burkholderia pseudomallei]|nr:UDP-N-acetylmuramate--alanine ligase [Burkholderia pseudomallei]
AVKADARVRLSRADAQTLRALVYASPSSPTESRTDE